MNPIDTIHDRLAAVAADFRAGLPERLAALRRQAEIALRTPAAREDHRLYGLLHSLAGTAGTLGQHSVAAAAQALAERVEAWVDDPPSPGGREAIAEAIARLDTEGLWVDVVPASGAAPSGFEGAGARIAVIDDDPCFSQALAALLEPRGYQIACYHRPAEFEAARRHDPPPELLLLDLDFPEGPIAGAETVATLHAQGMPRVAVVCISRHDDMTARLAAHRAGAGHYLVKPVDAERLGALVDELVGHGAAPLRVLLVDNDRYALHAHQAMLESAGIDVLPCHEPMDVLAMAREHRPDVTVLDVYMPEVSGLEVAAVLRSDESLAWMPIIFLSAEPDARKRSRALAYGGDQFLVKPVAPAEFREAVVARGHRARVLKRMMPPARSRPAPFE